MQKLSKTHNHKIFLPQNQQSYEAFVSIHNSHINQFYTSHHLIVCGALKFFYLYPTSFNPFPTQTLSKSFVPLVRETGRSISFFSMVLVLFVFILMVGSIQGQPSPGYYPSSRVGSIGFNQGFRNLWGPQHQRLDQNTLTLWLDRSSGSGFKSLHPYQSGYFGAAIKLQPGYTAGVITSLYLSNNEAHPGDHDEIDIEFLGTTPGKPYTLQTNVYIRGSGDRNIIGRELKFHLWFDPTKDFHSYAILWTSSEIIFLVDDVPIRRYPRKSDETFPLRPMWAYGSVWDASSWATENGKYKADYRYQPFVGKYMNFKISGCPSDGSGSCQSASVSPLGPSGLSRQQLTAMAWAQRNYLVYNYCSDPKRDHRVTPEC